MCGVNLNPLSNSSLSNNSLSAVLVGSAELSLRNFIPWGETPFDYLLLLDLCIQCDLSQINVDHPWLCVAGYRQMTSTTNATPALPIPPVLDLVGWHKHPITIEFSILTPW